MNQDKLGKNFINDYSKKFRKKKTEKIEIINVNSQIIPEDIRKVSLETISNLILRYSWPICIFDKYWRQLLIEQDQLLDLENKLIDSTDITKLRKVYKKMEVTLNKAKILTTDLVIR
jgi:hypothetical protein